MDSKVKFDVAILKESIRRREFDDIMIDSNKCVLLQSRELNGFFSFRELDRSRVGIVLEKSLQDLVDQSAPTSSIQFRLACRGISGVSREQFPSHIINHPGRGHS